MKRAELEYIIKQDVKTKSIRWERVKLIQREIEDLLGKLYTKHQFNYLEAKRGLQLHIIAIDEILKKHQ